MKVVVLTPEDAQKEGARPLTSVPYPFIDLCMDAWHKEYGITTLIHQKRTLVDLHIEKWAKANGVYQIRWDGFWEEHQFEDLYIRDLQMLRWEQPDYVLAFQPMDDDDERVAAGITLAKRHDMNVKTLNGNFIYDMSLLQYGHSDLAVSDMGRVHEMYYMSSEK